MASSPFWLDAFCRGWLLRSPAAFQCVLATIKRESPREYDDSSTLVVRTELLGMLQGIGRGLSMDALELYIERGWFPEGNPCCAEAKREVSIAEHMVDWAGDMLVLQGTGCGLKSEDTARYADALARWRWTTLAVPADVLVAARWVDHEASLDGYVDVLTPGLKSVLGAGPVANTHLHAGAALSFAAFWSARMTGEHRTGDLEGLFGSPFGSKQALDDRLDQAAIARWVMAMFLRMEGRAGTFRDYFERHAHELAARLAGQEDATVVARVLRESILHLAQATTSDQKAPTRGRVIAELTQAARSLQESVSRTSSRARRRGDEDPIWHLMTPENDRVLADQVLLHRGLRYIWICEKQRRPDELFSSLFWQYVRVRCQLYAWLVQAPIVEGLGWFGVHSERRRKLEVQTQRGFIEAIHLESRGARLASLELRMPVVRPVLDITQAMAREILLLAPEKREARGQTEAAYLDRASRGHGGAGEDPEGECELGFVLLFSKTTAVCRPGSNKNRISSCRYGGWFQENMTQARNLGELLEKHPSLLVLWRGIDIAGRELNVPTWATLPLIRVLQRASVKASSSLTLHASWPEVPPMRITAHVGEDFRTPHEGLRRIHEMLGPGGLCEGDRLGHAVALGIDLERWTRKNTCILQPRLERLADLLWELDLCEQGHVNVSGSYLARLSSEIRRLASPLEAHWWLGDDPVAHLRRFRTCLLEGNILERMGYPNLLPALDPAQRGARVDEDSRRRKRPAREASDEELLRDFLTSNELYVLCEQPIEVRLNGEALDALNQAQAYVRREVARLEITVETNPSSNLIVRDFERVEDLPALRLMPIRERDLGPRVQVTVNDDDPITFATRLADEYAYLYAAMLRDGAESADALRWIEEAREAGWRARFTLPISRDPDVLRRIAET